jgi:hypothetical protein
LKKINLVNFTVNGSNTLVCLQAIFQKEFYIISPFIAGNS